MTKCGTRGFTIIEILLSVSLIFVFIGVGAYIYRLHTNEQRSSKQSSTTSSRKTYTYNPRFEKIAESNLSSERQDLFIGFSFDLINNWQYRDSSPSTQAPGIPIIGAAFFAPATVLKTPYVGTVVTNPTIGDDTDDVVRGTIIRLSVSGNGSLQKTPVTSSCKAGTTLVSFNTFKACRDEQFVEGVNMTWNTSTDKENYVVTLSLNSQATSEQRDYGISLTQAWMNSFQLY